MTSPIRWTIAMTALLLLGALNVQGFIPDDADGDGVPDSVDVCPGEDASGFDRDGDGCIDDAIGARHVEYWSTGSPAVTYVINSSGAPGVAGTADNNAVIAAFDSWTSIAGTGLAAAYGGTTPQSVANGLDGVNLVTFVDNTYPFGLSTLAVGLSTSFESDTLIAGRVWRKGEIYDADMLFSPTKTFKAGGAGPGTDIQGVATHEAGHLFGISHTAVQSATMFYVLPGGLAARSLTGDDAHVYYKGYATPMSLSGASRLKGEVRHGQTDDPVGGALVFAIEASGPGDTAACEITMPDGSFDFAGLPDGDYYVAITPLDGTSGIGYIAAGNVNAFVASYVNTDFLPEYYDLAESNADVGGDKTAVSVSAGATSRVEVITNIDGTPPTVAEVRPVSGSADAAIDGAFLVRFSERIMVGTVSPSFSFRQGGTGLGGNIAVIRDDSVIVFTPATTLEFSTEYTLRIDTDLQDRAGNALEADFVATFTTEAEPPLSISSLAPSKGVAGTTMVINGRGFSVSPGPAVTFNGAPAGVLRAEPARLVVMVPDGVTTGDVVVTNPDLQVSNALVFTALSATEVARGYESGTVSLSGTPHAIALSPDGSYAYIAVQGGVEAVVVDAGLGGYLTSQLIGDPAEFTDLAATPDGRRVYAVSRESGEMIEIVSDPSAGLLFNTIIASRPLGAKPRGIEVDPFGYRAYISTDAAEVQVWDVRLGSPTYQQQVGVLYSPDGIPLAGAMGITPDGGRLLALASAGEVLFYDLGPDTLVDRVSLTLDPRAITIDAQGERAYVAHDDGTLSVVSIGGATPFFVQGIATGGSLRGLDTTPAGLYLYATDRAVDNLKIVDLDETHTTFRSVVATAPMSANPVDIAMSGDGVYAYSVLQGDGGGSAPRMVVTTIGDGPVIHTMVPQAGQPGTKVVITGQDLYTEGASAITVDFNGVVASPLDRSAPQEIIVTVPPGVTSGPVTVRLEYTGNPTQVSNAFYFEAIEPASPDNLREAAVLEYPSTPTLFCDYQIQLIAYSPDGSYLYTACGGGDFAFVFDVRPGSPQFNQLVGSFALGAIPSDVAITADGKVSIWAADGQPKTFYCDPNDPRFGTPGPDFDFGTFLGGAARVAASPDNRTAVVLDGASYMLVDATGLSDGVEPVVVDQMYPYAIGEDVTFHPTGRAAFMINVTSPPGLIVLNTDRFSGGFGNATTITLSAGPTSLDVSRDGKYVYVYCGDPSPDWSLDVYRVNCEKPDSCFYDSYCHLSINDVEVISGDNTIRIAPQGTFGIRTQLSTGFIEYDVNCPGSEIPWALDSEIGLEYAFTPDGTRIYSAGGSTYGLRMYDFLAAESIAVASGNNQTGVAGELLPAPIRVQVGTTAAGRQLDGIPVTFEALNNGALLTGDGFKAKTIVATDVDGFAEIQWRLGDLGANSVRVTATGLTGQPFNFTATANPDPSTLPLSLAEVIPLNNTPDVSPTTALLATFSRAVDPTTIGAATLYLRDAISTEMVPATYGFTDSNRKVSLTPGATLSLGTAYELVLTAGIQAMGGSPLSNPGSSYFTTIGSVPLRVSSVSPPSALAGVTVVVSGTGFDATPSNNTVLFNSLAVTPVSGGPGSLNVVVPVGAASGTISVVVNAQTSNALPFTVLTPNTSPIDEVIANVGTGTGAKSCAVTPDGALVYTVGTDGDVIIPVDVDGQTALSAIRVGDQPVAIVIHPDGKIAYVANFNSGTVSVINTDPASPDFNKVVQTITVGANPADLAVDAAGNRLLVANAGASTVSVVDANSSSSTYHAVVANVGTGTGAKSVAVSPDGTVYVGTDTGFAVIDQSNSVVANVGTGTGGKSVAVSPDGTLLFILTTDGEILVVDIQEGSPSQNEVVANVGAGNGGKSVAVSPDGTLLYLIPEVGDEVLVFEVSIVAGVSATDPDGAAPHFRVESRLLTTIETGSDPSSVAVDPSGSGAVFITNEGDRTLSIVDRNPVPIEACFHVFPPLLIVKLNNPYVTGWVQLPAGYAVRDIDVNTVRMNGAVAAIPDKVLYRDFSFDHVEDVIFTFHRAELIATLDPTRLLHRVTITGDVGDRTFTGESWLIAIFPRIGKPGSQGNTVTPGRKTTISWLTPAAYSVDFVDVHVSYDNGETWEPIATQVENLGEVSWTPSPPSSGEQKTGIVMVTLYQNGEVLLQGQSAEPFTIAAPQAMTQLKSFDVAVEDGTAVLRWQTLVEAGMDGFQVLRSDAEEGVYAAVAKETIAAAGRSEGASYEYRDESVHANRTYWYKLQEVRSDGSGQEFGPYSLSYQLAYGLEQNVPNPFNPTTTIKYALAADGPVTLTIYDVKGARVRELVNESRRADVYRVVWDGSNENGERVASGVYFYRLVAGTYTQTRKMMLLK